MLDRGHGGVRRRGFFGSVGDYVRTPIRGGVVETVESLVNAVPPSASTSVSGGSFTQVAYSVSDGSPALIEWTPSVGGRAAWVVAAASDGEQVGVVGWWGPGGSVGFTGGGMSGFLLPPGQTASIAIAVVDPLASLTGQLDLAAIPLGSGTFAS